LTTAGISSTNYQYFNVSHKGKRNNFGVFDFRKTKIQQLIFFIPLLTKKTNLFNVLKKLIPLIFFILISLSSQSQVLISLLLGDKLNSDKIDFGLEGGGNFSSIFNMDSKKYVKDWNLGFYFVINLKDSWYVNTGVLVKAKLGSGKLTDKDLQFLNITKVPDTVAGGNYYQKINYFLVPAMMRYKFDNGFYVEGGLQAGLKYKAWVEYIRKDKEEDIIVKKFNKDAINPIDLGALAGIGYRFKKRTGWTVGIKYYYGFTNVYKGVAGTKNNSLFLKANIPIGAGEKAQKKRAEKAKKRAERKAAKHQ